ncbi:MAG TPA: hypothetical protein VF746_26155 [Longimicrobium sp.]|jgi:hypothetical protein
MSTPDPPQESAASVVCPNCGNRNGPDAERCYNCSQLLGGARTARTADEGGVPQARPVQGGYPGELSAPFLEVLGYLIIVFGVILGIWTISTLGTTELPAYDALGVYTGGGRRANGLGWMLGIATIVQSVIAGTLCFTVAATARNTVELRRALDRQAKAPAPGG